MPLSQRTCAHPIYISLKPHPDIYLKARSGAGRPPRVPAVHVAPLSTWHRNIETAQYTACKETIRDYDGTCPWGGEQSPHGCADGRLGDYTTKKALDAGFDCVTCDQKGGQTPPLPRPPPTHTQARQASHPTAAMQMRRKMGAPPSSARSSQRSRTTPAQM